MTKMDLTRMKRAMVELLSEYGVDRSGVDAAIDIAIEYGENEYTFGYENGYDKCAVDSHIPTD